MSKTGSRKEVCVNENKGHKWRLHIPNTGMDLETGGNHAPLETRLTKKKIENCALNPHNIAICLSPGPNSGDLAPKFLQAPS